MTNAERQALIEDYDWVEWKSRKHGTTTAHALDPDSEENTGVLRALNGSVIGDEAVEADPNTPKDGLCLHIIVARYEREAKREARAEAKAEAKEARDAEKAERKAEREKTKNARRTAAAKKAAATKAAKKATSGKEPKKATRAKGSKRGSVLFEDKNGALTASDDGNVDVTVYGKFVKVVDGKKAGKTPELRVTAKSWGVYSKGKRVAFGRL